MLTLRGIITLIVLVILFALAVVWISKQGGWKGEGCGGNCASCHSRCENPDPGKKHRNPFRRQGASRQKAVPAVRPAYGNGVST